MKPLTREVLETNQDKIVDAIWRATKKFASLYYPENTDEKSQKVSKIFEEIYGTGDMARSYIKKLSEALELDLTYIPSYVVSTRLAAIVPLKTGSGHNYPVGKPCLGYSGGRYVRMDGSLGNSLPSQSSYMRPATKEEIETLVESIIKKNPEDYFVPMLAQIRMNHEQEE